MTVGKMYLLFITSSAGLFGNAWHHITLPPLKAQIWLPATSGFSQTQATLENEEISVH